MSFWILIIIANVVISYKGFNDYNFMSQYMLRVKELTVDKDYKRLLTSGFLHANFMHLGFNMLTLYFFASYLEKVVGSGQFALIYLVSLVAGNLLAWRIHEKDYSYAAIGASGAVNGVIFSTIALIPGMNLYLFFIPIPIPASIYALFFIMYSIYGMNAKNDNIGHEAHLGGALAGTLLTVLLHPNVLSENLLTIAIITIPTVIALYLMIKNPNLIQAGQAQALLQYFKGKNKKEEQKFTKNIDDSYNNIKNINKKEIDEILDKINEKGFDSLTESEKRQLEEYSNH